MKYRFTSVEITGVLNRKFGGLGPTKLKHPSYLMQKQNRQCDTMAYAFAIQGYIKEKNLSQGKRIHAHIICCELSSDLFLSNNLVNMYGKCGSLDGAERVFVQMLERDAVSWNAMIGAYIQHGHAGQSFELFRQMSMEDVKLSRVTFLNILKACSEVLAEVKLVHAHVSCSGFESDVIIGTSIMNMYSTNKALDYATAMFYRLHQPTVVSWNVLIAANIQNGYIKEALKLYRIMNLAAGSPDRITFITILNAFDGPEFRAEGKCMHAHIIDYELQMDLVIVNSLISMYGKCKSIEYAWRLFDNFPYKDIISWNAMIAAYAQNEDSIMSFGLFRQIYLEGEEPDSATFGSILNTCCSPDAFAKGKQLHACVLDRHLESDTVVGTALVDMYGKCGSLEDAQRMFNKMLERNVVSWNAVITMFVQHGNDKEALIYFHQMQLEGKVPNKITFISLLNTCANLAALTDGMQIHTLIMENGYEIDILVGNALINMYSRCGDLQNAQGVFNKMPVRDMISWNVLIGGYCQHAYTNEAIELFERMCCQHIKADGTTFISVITACGHAGLLDEGLRYHSLLLQADGTSENVDHFACLVDLLGRCGQLDKAEDVIAKMPFQPDESVWMPLLGACRIHSDVERGKHVAQRILELNPRNAGAYILMSNIYADVGRWHDVEKIRRLMQSMGLWKEPELVVVGSDGENHSFPVEDTLCMGIEAWG